MELVYRWKDACGVVGDEVVASGGKNHPGFVTQCLCEGEEERGGKLGGFAWFDRGFDPSFI